MKVEKQLRKEDFKFILLNGKLPIEKWDKNYYKYNDLKILEHKENLGLICGSGLIVIDADTDRLNKLIKEKFPKTFTVKTKNGYHYYYYCFNFLKKKVLKDKKEHLGEIQSNGSYIVCPGSIHPSGIKYEVKEDIPIQEIKKEFIDDILKKYYSSMKVSKEIVLEGAREGLRNESMFKLACTFRDKDMSLNETFSTLKRLNKDNKPPLSENEIETIVKSAYKYKKNVKEDFLDKLTTIDNRIKLVQEFHKHNPFFYDKHKAFWLWDKEKYKYVRVDETDLLNSIRKGTKNSVRTINSTIKSEIINALKEIGRENIAAEPRNSWVQFKDIVYDIDTDKTYRVDPKYFFTNPVPFSLGNSTETPVMDKLFEEWVVKEGLQDKTYIETLYEMIAYSLLKKQFLHTLFALVGNGSNGKSCYLQVLKNFVGEDNVASTEMKLLTTVQFETATLHRKSVAIMGEVDTYDMKNTNVLKKLTGEDDMRYCYKGKDPFTEKSFTTVFMATNSLPVTPDKSFGFYRRWLVIDFPHVFEVGRDVVGEIPKEEYNNLALKCINLVKRLKKNRKFTNHGNMEERMKRYEERSNPLLNFIEEECYEEPENYVSLINFYKRFNVFLKEKKLRMMTKRQVSNGLKREGFRVDGKKITTEQGFETRIYAIWGLGFKVIDDKIEVKEEFIEENTKEHQRT